MIATYDFRECLTFKVLPYLAVYKPHFLLPFVPKTECRLYTKAFSHVSYGTRFKPSLLKTWVRLIHGQLRYIRLRLPRVGELRF